MSRATLPEVARLLAVRGYDPLTGAAADRMTARVRRFPPLRWGRCRRGGRVAAYRLGDVTVLVQQNQPCTLTRMFGAVAAPRGREAGRHVFTAAGSRRLGLIEVLPVVPRGASIA